MATKMRHPGEFIKESIFDPTGLSLTEISEVLRVHRVTVSNLVNSVTDLSFEMALRIEKAFDYPMTRLLIMQLEYDIELTRKKKTKGLGVRRFERPVADVATAA
jgi:addiction module HigA family antidote